MLMRAIGSIWTATFSFMGGGAFSVMYLRARIEGRQHMARQTARRNQHGVEAQIISGVFGMRHQPDLRGSDDARLLARRHRIGGVIEACRAP